MKLRFTLIFILFFALVISILYIMLPWLQERLEQRRLGLEKEIQFIKSEFVFASYYLVSKESNRVDFELTIYDTANNRVTNNQFSIPGNDVFLESRVIRIEGGKAIIFPLRLFSDILPSEKGIDIVGLYSKEGFPLIYRMENPGVSNLISDMFSYYVLGNEKFNLRKYFIKSEVMDVVVHQIDSKIESNLTYECLIHPNGSIELRKKNE